MLSRILIQFSIDGWTCIPSLLFTNVVHWRREWQTTSVVLPWEPHKQNVRQKDRIWKDELPRSVGAQYATGDQWRNNPRKSEEMESKQKQHPAVDMIGDVSKSNSFKSNIASVQFSSVVQSCLTLCDPMNCSTPGPPVHHRLPEFTQTHVHQVNDAIQPSHPRSSPTPPAPNPSQHQSLFQWVNSSHEVAKVLEFQL